MNNRMKIISVLLCMLFLFGNLSFESLFALKVVADEDYTDLVYQPITYESHSDSNNDDYLCIDSEQTHFLLNKNVVFSCSVSSGKNIVDFTYSQNGFNIISVDLDDNNESRIVVELACASDLGEYTFEITASLENGQVVKGNLFAIKNDYGVFISTFSLDNARERYYEYAIQNNILTEEHAIQLFMDSFNGTADEYFTVEYAISNISTTTTTMSAGSETVLYCGYLKWRDDNGVNHNLRKVRVEIYNINNPETPLAATHTNNEGYFEVNITGEIDTFLKIYAGDLNAMVKSPNLETAYYYETEVIEGNLGCVSYTLHATFGMDNDLGKALQISQAILTARDYAKEMMSEMPSCVSVVYPYDEEIEEEYDPTNENGCYYDNVNKKINITGRHPINDQFPHSYASWDVIMHEYGHHIQQIVGNSSTLALDHWIELNSADLYGNKNIGIRLAWAESWPTVFALMAQQYYGVYLTNIDTVADSSYTVYNGLDYDIESAEIYLGEACEQSIMAVLWDLYDINPEENDFISLSHREYWNVTTKDDIKTFSDFINYFYTQYPEYTYYLGRNLSKYGMAATKPSISNGSDVSQAIPPVFTWIAQGGSEIYYNNLFALIFYDDRENEILRTSSTTSTTYTLSQYEWESILTTCGDTYAVAVASYQLSIPVTGAYISERSEHLTKPQHDLPVHSFTNYAYHSETQHIVYCDCGESMIQDHDYSYTDITDTHHTVICACSSVVEEHYNHHYARNDQLTHYVYCECGHYIGTNFHVVPAGNALIKFCIHCGEKLKMSEDIVPVPGLGWQSTGGLTYITDAGSYVDSDGVIYLVDSDMELYLAGVLDVYALAQTSGSVTK